MDSRPKIEDTQTGRFYPISTFEDLKETLELMRMASSMVRPYCKLVQQGLSTCFQSTAS
jgi:hypothetical protein